jgi:transmembrane sensor
MDQYEHIDDLIAKHLAAETSAAEDDIVDNWIAISETNRMYYSELKLIYEVAEEKIVLDKINIHAAWSRFSKKLPEQITEKTIDKNEQTVIKKLIASFYGKAAVFICAIGVCYLIYNQVHTEKMIVLSSSVSTTLRNTLPDGSSITLSPKSSVTYFSSFNTRNRSLKLAGEAYFHVQHNADLPFIVNTGAVFVKDIGTSFTVKAISSDSTVTVNVEEGEVSFYSSQNSGVTLIKNETGIYNLVSQTFRKKNSGAPDTGPETDQILSFENSNLELVIDTLNKVYNEHILLSCEKLKSLELTAEFKEKTAAPIIETIAETFGLSVIRANGTVTLNSKTCKE